MLPIHKSGAKDLPENYRPISILPTISKIFEKHVSKHFYCFLQKYDIISGSQSGFRSKHSCHTALVKLIDEWITSIDNGELIVSIFLDLRKAFDLVDHDILVNKLEIYRCSSISKLWFQSYLDNRTQRVCIGNTLSSESVITRGVPQGSILGPLLFILFINDLPLQNLNVNIDMYADDTTVHTSGRSVMQIQNQLNTDLSVISNWCYNNNMFINPAKTTAMIIGSRQKLHVSSSTDSIILKIGSDDINLVEKHKLLGITVDNHLDWTNHIDHVCKSVNSKLLLLNRIKKFLDIDARKLFYNAYILPIFDYCCTVWGNTSEENLKRLEKLQKQAARTILNAPVQTPSYELLKSLDWLSIRTRINYHKLVLVYKILSNQAPAYLSTLCKNIRYLS